MNTITVLTVIFQLIIVASAVYAFVRLDFKFKDTIFLLLIATMMVPGKMYIIPQYKIIQKMGLLNTLMSIVIPGAWNSFLWPLIINSTQTSYH